MQGTTHTTRARPGRPAAATDPERSVARLALSIAWSLAEPARVGELAPLPLRSGIAVLGRGAAVVGEAGARLVFGPKRADGIEPSGPLVGSGLSRRQLLARAYGGRVELERIGRTRLIVGGQAVDRAALEPGATCVLEGQLVLLATVVEDFDEVAPRSGFDIRDLSSSVERQDVPLAVRRLLGRALARDAQLRARFADDSGEARVSPDLVVALLAQPGPLELRELVTLLDLAISGSSAGYVALTPSVLHRSLHPATALPSREQVEGVLALTRGDLSRAWKELGLSSRDSLNRLLRKYGLGQGSY